MGKGQMEHRRKFTRDTQSVRDEGEGRRGEEREGWVQRRPEGEGKVEENRGKDMQRERAAGGDKIKERPIKGWGGRRTGGELCQVSVGEVRSRGESVTGGAVLGKGVQRQKRRTFDFQQ